jgi:hypothetical protein
MLKFNEIYVVIAKNNGHHFDLGEYVLHIGNDKFINSDGQLWHLHESEVMLYEEFKARKSANSNPYNKLTKLPKNGKLTPMQIGVLTAIMGGGS